MNKIKYDDIDSLSLGSSVLGSGGGGDPYIGSLMVKNALKKYGSVELISPDKLSDDAFIVPIAAFGAPLILIEKLFSGQEFYNCLKSIENHFKRKADAVISIEAGGLNGVIPIATASKFKLPFVDCDGMGRAFPRLEMVTFTLDGINVSPVFQTDEKGNKIFYNTINNVWGEKLLGSSTIMMGGSCAVSCYTMSGKQLKKSAVFNTISLAKKIGNIIKKKNINGNKKANEITKMLHGKILFEGKVSDVTIKTEGRWNKGICKLKELRYKSSKVMIIDFQNEYLVAKINDKPICTTPDLIVVLDKETGYPINAEKIKYGMRVIVIGLPCDKKWKTKKGLQISSPSYFNYKYEYKPI